ncbi:hypothetical protein HHK36_004289 [Tetracentron sinense]|uniref:Histone-lysine N-methyltransferase ASHH2 n=1 Tax=Tetracentron sinense TaxID=13715 RepID=A0A834ZQW3_TETSI|nr:hypothetical protein HHK36_004289 [Tetracentron sinense]
MGSCENSVLVDEPPDSHCSLPVGTVGGALGNYLGSISSGLGDECQDSEGCENSGLGQRSCSEVASLLFNCNGDTTNRPVLEQRSCPELAFPLSHCNGHTTDALDGFPASSENDSVVFVNSGIDTETSIVFRDESENENGLVLEATSYNDNGVNGFLSNEGDKDHLCILGSEGSCLQKEGSQGKDGSGNQAQDGELSLAFSPVNASPRNCTQHKEQKDTDSVNAPSEEGVTDLQEVMEEKFDALAWISANPSTQTSVVEENTCNLTEGSPITASDCAVVESASLQSCQPFVDEDIGSSKSLAVTDLRETDVLSDAFMCSSVVDFTVPADNEGKDNVCFDYVSVTECNDTICPSPRRSTRVRKSIWMTETRKDERQCRKTVNNMLLPRGTIEINLKVARGKRSYSCKPARSSIWGALGNIIQVFDQNNVVLKHNCHSVKVQNQRSRKARSGQGGERRKKTRAGGNSRGSKGKARSSTSCIRSKVKTGDELGQDSPKAVLSAVVDSLVSVKSNVGERLPGTNCGIGLETPKLANDMEHKLGKDLLGLRQFQCPNSNLENVMSFPDFSDLDAQLADKDLESIVTQDMSVRNNTGDCLGISSQIGIEALVEAIDSGYLDPGTSPDSEVINLIQDVHVGTRVHEDLQDTVVTSSQAVVAPADVTLNIPKTSVKKGKKKDRVKGIPRPRTGFCTVEDKVHALVNTKKTKNSTKRGSGRKEVDALNPSQTFLSATGNASSNASSIEGFPVETLPLSRINELGVSQEALKVESSADTCGYSRLDAGIRPSESWTSDRLFPFAKTKGFKPPTSSRAGGRVNKRRSSIPDSVRRRRGNASEPKKENRRKSVSKSKVKDRGMFDQIVCKEENGLETGGIIDFSSGTIKESDIVLSTVKGKLKIICDFAESNVVESGISDDYRRANTGNKFAAEGISSSAVVSNGFGEQYLRPRIAWVRCDDCHKWRCISAMLADSIEETNCKWTCKDNTDKAFADCSIPQEKSNAEINAELEISDASCEEDAYEARLNSKGFERRQSKVPQQSAWKLIKSNLFLHRNRKSQTIDEIMVCHCKPPLDGRLGCRDECLNRMLNIECVRGTCPCGDLCSNQQFQKRNYAQFKWFRCGKKGYGLQLLENVSQGKFLIEYIGEVLDLHAYEARQRDYASRGQKHFYFMTLNGSEVIDAYAKGNLGRFINHGCDPNCRTEKWMVNGEVCIGLFALRDIKKGEEVTFDYNYVRVFGAAAKKCVCGSSQCQGYIGGDPLNTEAIVQGDSDEEYPEPVMVHEDGESVDCMARATNFFDAVEVQPAEISLQTGYTIENSAPTSGQVEASLEKEDTVNRSPLQMSLKMEVTIIKSPSAVQPVEVSLQTEDTMSKSISAVQPLDMALEKEETMNKSLQSVQTLETSSLTAHTVSKSLSDSVDSNKKSKSDTVKAKADILKLHPLMKSSHSSSSIKKGKSTVYPMLANKPQVVDNKPKKLLEGAANGRFEGVEEKLNELLDADGGISKRKDATKGYLKLLLVTAAWGDNGNGEAIQSARDLSMILDALLKTKSRVVLVDIISKNGLQMLHNIMKQNRRNFNKTPILRKLLKVLEFLALREILTLEHINGGPPCHGMERLVYDSSVNQIEIQVLISLVHIQVHQIARNFRDRWIRRTIRKVSCSDRDDGKLELQGEPNCNWFSSSYKRWHDQSVRPSEAIDCVSRAMLATTPLDANPPEGSSAPTVAGCPTNGTKTRKRKSRWDQPAEMNPDPQSPKHSKEHKIEPSSQQKLESNPQQPEIGKELLDQGIEVNREENDCNGRVYNLLQQDESATAYDARQHVQEDAPPGFSSPLNITPAPSNASTTNSFTHPQQNVSHLSCAGDVVMGCPQEKYLSHLPVSYGIPLSLVHQFGTSHAETDSWMIGPTMLFHPFPPLPPFPRDKSDTPPCAANPAITKNVPEEVQRPGRGSATYHTGPSSPCTSGARPPDMEVTGSNNQQMLERVGCSSYGLGRRYFRQQKWNSRNCGPPWLRRRNGWGFKGNNSRSGEYNVSVGNVASEVNGPCSEDVTSRGEKVGSTFHQLSQHQNQH